MHLENEFEQVYKKDQISVTDKKDEAYSNMSLPVKGAVPLEHKHSTWSSSVRFWKGSSSKWFGKEDRKLRWMGHT